MAQADATRTVQVHQHPALERKYSEGYVVGLTVIVTPIGRLECMRSRASTIVINCFLHCLEYQN